MERKTIAVLILASEVSLGAYLAFVVWVFSVWMVDDSQAFRMAPSDWYFEGARRLGAALAVGTIFGGLTYFANRQWVAPLLSESSRLATGIAVGLGSCVVLSGAAGAIRFVITKPFM